MTFPMIAARVFGTPLLVDPAKGAAFLAGLGPRLVNGALELRGLDGVPEERLARARRVTERASVITDDLGERARRNGSRLYRVRDGVAVIEVTGTLVHRGDWIGESSGVTSYEGITAQVVAAGADPGVRGIALELDTFGGEVAGAFDLGDAIRAARGQKPVWAFVAESALSAGYVLASQATRIVLPRTGEVGSIGVLTIHADYSQRLADEGVAVTLIHAGAHKVDGNPYEALPEDVRDDIQARVERSRQLFAETVGKGRGRRLDAAAALATEAMVYQGADAVAAGLADEVADLRTAFAAFVAEVNRPRAASTPVASAAAMQERPSMKNTSTGPVAESTAAAEDVTPEDSEPQDDAPAPQASPAATAAAPAAEAVIPRAQAAELAELAQTAARLGVKVDVAEAIRTGQSADQLRTAILDQLAEKAQPADVVVTTPAASSSKPKDSPIVAAARRAAEAQQAAAQKP